MLTSSHLLILLPLLTGAGLLLAGRRADRLAAPVAIGAHGIVLGLAIAVAIMRPNMRALFLAGLPFGVAVDGLSALMVVLVAGVTLPVLVYASAELAGDDARARFFGLMSVFTAAMLTTVTATSLLPLLMAWEVMGACSYALIGFWWRDGWRARAGTTAFLTTRAGDLGLYLAAGAAFAGLGSLSLERLAVLPSPWSHVVAAGVLAAAAGKSAQLPFSFWLSRAMAGPSSVSALLHSATMVAAGGYLLLRVSPLLHTTGWAGLTAAWLGAATAIAVGAVATLQDDLKQLAAASTSAQLGFVFLAAGAGSVAGGAAHVVGHAAVKSLLLLGGGAFLAVLGTTDLARLRGAGRRMPWTGAGFAVGAVTLAGTPPLALWLTKDLAMHGAPIGLTIASYVAAAFSAAYAGRALVTVLARPTRQAEHGSRSAARSAATLPPRSVSISPERTPTAMLAALAALVLAVLVVVPVWLDVLPPPAPAPGILSALVALGVLVLVVGAARRGMAVREAVPDAAAKAGRRWLWLEEAARTMIARPVMASATALARFDDRVLAAGVRGAAQGVEGLARVTHQAPERAIAGTVRRGAAGVRRLGHLARLPQTGQLHQYYAQAVVVLVVLVVAAVLLTGYG